MLTPFSRRTIPNVRPITPDWSADCAALHAPSFSHPWSEFEFERLLAAENSLADGAFEGDGKRLLGFVLSRRAVDEAEILTVVVEAAVRQRGLGGALIGSHLARLAAFGTKAVFLEVEEGNRPALTLYRHYDFHEVGRRHGYYRKVSGAPATALVLRRDIQ
jgi:ribosomal-protein-alanine N-acetyltransferase